jgi:hypothetical protein
MTPDEGTTYHAIAQLDEVGGRFTVLGRPVVVGTSAQAPVAGGQRDPVPAEMPLGYQIDEMPALEPSIVPPVEAQDGDTARDAPSSHVSPGLVSERGAGSLPFSRLKRRRL